MIRVKIVYGLLAVGLALDIESWEGGSEESAGAPTASVDLHWLEEPGVRKAGRWLRFYIPPAVP